MSDTDTTAPPALPLPPVGAQLLDPRGIAWDVVEHDDDRARLTATADPDLTRWATAERLADCEVVRERDRARRR